MKNQDLSRHVYNIDPNAGIYSNMLGFLSEFILIETFNRFNPGNMAKKLLETGEFDFEDVYAFEDVTWDSVFGKLKTLEFAPVVESEDSVGVMDMAYYLDYSDMVHSFNAESLSSLFGEKAVEVSSAICVEIWNSFKDEILNDLIENGCSKERVYELLKKNMPAIFEAAIKLHLTEFEDGINAELHELYDRTNEVFEKINFDDTATFKLIYASIIKGTEVVICNPEYLQLGDRIKSAIKYYISGSSVVFGQRFSELIPKEKFEVIEKYAPGIVEYIPTLTSMMISSAFIITLDKNPLMIELTDAFNEVPTITGNIAYYRENAEKLEQLAAKLAGIDYDEFNRQISFYDKLALNINDIQDPYRLNQFLLDHYKSEGKELPWGNRSIEEHWADRNSRLTFK